jgi:hypothetical protein
MVAVTHITYIHTQLAEEAAQLEAKKVLANNNFS